VEHLKDTSLSQVLASVTDIRIGWRGLPGTNTVAYYENTSITNVKSFIIFSPGPNVIKHFCP
jgi:hypothetical protein